MITVRTPSLERSLLERIVRSAMLPAVALATLVTTADSNAQCPDWRARGTGLRVNGDVYDSTVWDPDGTGPQPPLLVVGGAFSSVGGPDGLAVRNIAAWDGSRWHSLG